MASKKEESQDAPPNKGGGGGKLAMLLGGVVAVVVLQTLLAFALVKFLGLAPPSPEIPPLSASDSKGSGGDRQAAPVRTAVLPDGITKTVSVGGATGRNFLKVSVFLEYDPEAFPEMATVMEGEVRRVEAVISRVLSKSSFDSLAAPGGQEAVRLRMLAEINQELPVDVAQIHDILITDWLLQ